MQNNHPYERFLRTLFIYKFIFLKICQPTTNYKRIALQQNRALNAHEMYITHQQRQNKLTNIKLAGRLLSFNRFIHNYADYVFLGA